MVVLMDRGYTIAIADVEYSCMYGFVCAAELSSELLIRCAFKLVRVSDFSISLRSVCSVWVKNYNITRSVEFE